MGLEEKSMEERILNAAEELFLEQGFANTTTGQIANLAGCNQALVHYYYRTKDNLFERIFEQKAGLLFANILKVESSEMPFEEKVLQMVATYFDFLRQNPRLAPFVLNEILFNPARLRFLIDKLQQYPKYLFAQFDPLLNGEIAQGNIRPILTMDLLMTIVSLSIAPFFILPILQKASDMPDVAVDEILERRKQEVIETVSARIRNN